MLPRVILIVIVAAIAAAGWFASCGLLRYRDAIREIGPLEPRGFESPTLLVLGSGGAFANPARFGPALAFGAGDEAVLLDAGRGVAERLRAAGIPASQPERVLLTSLRPENTVGLDDLLVAGWRAGRSRPLVVVGPPGSAALLRAVEAAQAPALRSLAGELGLEPEAAGFAALELAADATLSAGAIAIEAVWLAGDSLPALAYRLEADGRSAVVGGTGAGSDRLGELARGADVLAHGAIFLDSVEAAAELADPEEANRLRREARLHTPLRELAGLAQRAGARRLVLVRLSPPPLFDFQFERLVGERYRGEVRVAADGDEITL